MRPRTRPSMLAKTWRCARQRVVTPSSRAELQVGDFVDAARELKVSGVVTPA